MSRAATDGSYARKEVNTRISYYDPPNQALLDRLMAGTGDAHEDVDGDDGDAQATMTSVEEMLEGYEWATDDILGQTKARGNVDVIAARLLDELTALEKVNFKYSHFIRACSSWRFIGQHLLFPRV
jgi:exocyst complex component 1